MMKIPAAGLVALLIAIQCVSCGGKTEPVDKNLPEFAGAWKQVSSRGDEVIYTFKGKNKYSKKTARNTTHGAYRVEGSSIILNPHIRQESELRNYKLDGETLAWTLPTGVRVQLTKHTE